MIWGETMLIWMMPQRTFSVGEIDLRMALGLTSFEYYAHICESRRKRPRQSEHTKVNAMFIIK